ncbi:hypothetical protein LCGC14_1504690 [marine sediment metagenome]|uniref:Uncharacterized protein n=1 Tax=marine sediment metagenome TaxID=412755 RepID=A0A0F9M4E8_9ZZZZ
MNEAEILKLVRANTETIVDHTKAMETISATLGTLNEGLKTISTTLHAYNVGLKGLHDRLVILEQRQGRSWVSRIFKGD